jgi:two-component system nitrogen regulation response regulator GlnG
VFTIELAPLRERLDDLPALLDHFIKLYNRELGKQIQSASADVLELLRAYPWPGNIRELQSAVKHALIHARGNVLTPECFPESCRASPEVAPTTAVRGAANSPQSAAAARLAIGQRFDQLLQEGHPNVYHVVHDEVDRFLLIEALRLSHGNQVEASRILGISRTTLRAKLDSLGLSIERQVLTNPPQDVQSLDIPPN